MNLLYIHSHDTGRYISPYGYNVPTPNLKILAQQGTLFRRAYTTNPTCSPSRAALMTGQYPHTCGMLGLVNRGFTLKDTTLHFTHHLKSLGYHTVLSGVQHEHPPEGQSDPDAGLAYDEVLHEQSEKTQGGGMGQMDIWRARLAAQWLRERGETDEPFFMAAGFVNTHQGFPQLGSVNPDYVMPPHPLPDTPDVRQEWAWYMESARYLDDCVGIIMQALRESGLDQNTIVLFTTDHGVPFPRMKCNLQDTGIGVSQILSYPGNPSSGRVTDAMTSNIDILPTLCELADIAKPEGLQGTSLKPLLDRETEQVHDAIFATVNYHAAYEPQRCIRTDQYKLIRWFDEEHDGWVAPNIDNGLSKRFMTAGGWNERPHPRAALYNLHTDPTENVNLIDEAAYATVKDELWARLDAWMQETDDPLLSAEGGRIPAPEGTRTNPRTAAHPGNEDFE